MSKIQITIDGVIYPITRDAQHIHDEAVHAALGTSSESELQYALDQYRVDDWYDETGKHLGPDADGLEMFRE